MSTMEHAIQRCLSSFAVPDETSETCDKTQSSLPPFLFRERERETLLPLIWCEVFQIIHARESVLQRREGSLQLSASTSASYSSLKPQLSRQLSPHYDTGTYHHTACAEIQQQLSDSSPPLQSSPTQLSEIASHQSSLHSLPADCWERTEAPVLSPLHLQLPPPTTTSYLPTSDGDGRGEGEREVGEEFRALSASKTQEIGGRGGSDRCGDGGGRSEVLETAQGILDDGLEYGEEVKGAAPLPIASLPGSLDGTNMIYYA
jgi:hypothetical protein